MEIGSRVKVFDGSWSLIVDNNNKYKHGYGIYLNKKEFKVLGIGLKLPSTDEGIYNDTIIKDINSDEIVFIQERFLKEIPKPKEIYVNIKARFDPNDLNEIKNIIDELEYRLHNLKVQILI